MRTADAVRFSQVLPKQLNRRSFETLLSCIFSKRDHNTEKDEVVFDGFKLR